MNPSIVCRRGVKRVKAYDEFYVEYWTLRTLSRQKGFGCDLSSSGLRFSGPLPHFVGTKIELDLFFSPAFPGLRRIHLPAKILRCHKLSSGGFDLACQFDAPPHLLEHLKTFIAWASKTNSKSPVTYGKRSYRRVQGQDLFLVEVSRAGEKLSEKGFGADLSEGGVHFCSVFPLAKDFFVDLILDFSPDFPGPTKVAAKARVVQCSLTKGTYYYQIRCAFEKDPTVPLAVRQFLAWMETR